MHVGGLVQDDPQGPFLVTTASGQYLLEQVREGAVAEVVQKRRSQRLAGPFGRDPLPKREDFMNRAEPRKELAHHERGADGVGKSRVIRAWIGV